VKTLQGYLTEVCVVGLSCPIIEWFLE